ncbi:MAG: radical SAM family heme chaperone HemW [Flavobacteriales bacterium]|jgi:oxygen-independent coproporphyrinogen-3 oxidase|nr:MAG: radical SAM family heme chaperone HemW [Flavobacteriales bacterium]
MAGLYVHIPFCRKACTYCDFHFSISTRGREAVLGAMHRELEARSAEPAAPLGTIYFGGGTPSLLAPQAIGAFVEQARRLLAVEAGAEVTLEANPDDITEARLEQWRAIGITRISLGTQSFREDRLRWMGRAHDADQALRSIGLIAKAGFASWTIDLIYGLPGMTLQEWEEQLRIALDHGLPHLSAYCLTVEPRTALAHQVGKHLVAMPGDEAQSDQFELLMQRMREAGLEHYEISNFGRPGHWSRHNTSYWEGVPYLGIGPSAHSFFGTRRRWNVANNARYVHGVAAGAGYWEEEALTRAQRTNERLLTGLRTSRGVELSMLELDVLRLQRAAVDRWMRTGHMELRDGRLVLTGAGRHFADRIASDLFIVDDAG